MYSNGYVGTSQDAQRIRRQEKQREEQRKKFEEQQQQQRDKVASAGLKQFGSSKSEAYEAAFKTETVGLVTREEFMQKRNTIQQRLEEEEAREKEAAEAAAAADKERRKREKAKAKLKAKLSFLGDVSGRSGGGGFGVDEGPALGAARWRFIVAVGRVWNAKAACPRLIPGACPWRPTPALRRATTRSRRRGRRRPSPPPPPPLRSAQQVRAARPAAAMARARARRPRRSGRSCPNWARTQV
jgi:hypothetical protein